MINEDHMISGSEDGQRDVIVVQLLSEFSYPDMLGHVGTKGVRMTEM